MKSFQTHTYTDAVRDIERVASTSLPAQFPNIFRSRFRFSLYYHFSWVRICSMAVSWHSLGTKHVKQSEKKSRKRHCSLGKIGCEGKHRRKLRSNRLCTICFWVCVCVPSMLRYYLSNPLIRCVPPTMSVEKNPVRFCPHRMPNPEKSFVAT